MISKILYAIGSISIIAILMGIDKEPRQLVNIISPDETKKVDVLTPDLINRLAVDTYISQISSSGLASLNSKLRYDDMNVANGGVARSSAITDSQWVQIYRYTGQSLTHGWVINFETKDHWLIRFVCDNEEIFGASGLLLEDVYIDSVYDLDNPTNDVLYQGVGIFWGEHDKLLYSGPNNYALKCNSSIAIYIKRETGESSKKFRAGLITISKGV